MRRAVWHDKHAHDAGFARAHADMQTQFITHAPHACPRTHTHCTHARLEVVPIARVLVGHVPQRLGRVIKVSDVERLDLADQRAVFASGTREQRGLCLRVPRVSSGVCDARKGDAGHSRARSTCRMH